MRVALCISGGFRSESNIIAEVCAHVLPEETVDVFASFWAHPDVSVRHVGAWLSAQTTDRISLCRWACEPVRRMRDWEKFAEQLPPTTSDEYLQELERWEYALQVANQLKCEQEHVDGRDYDAVVRVDCLVKLDHAPRLSKFTSILDDHVVIGHMGPPRWFPIYDFRLAMMSSRNMEIYSAIQTLHRRQYIMRSKTLELRTAFVDHFHHARLKAISVPVSYVA